LFYIKRISRIVNSNLPLSEGGVMREFFPVKLFILVTVCLFFSVNPLSAYDINLDFGNANGTPTNTFNAAAQAGEWNTLGLGAHSNIFNISGVATPVTALVTAESGGSGAGCSGDEGALFGDQIHSSNDSWTIALSGLNNETYDVYLYAPGNSLVPTGAMSVNGTPVSSIPGNAVCDLIDGTSYVSVQVSITDSTLTITGTNATGWSGLAGLQLDDPSDTPPQRPASIPTLTEWGMILMSLLMAGAAGWVLRKSRTTI
jgi:hypothetical protein